MLRITRLLKSNHKRQLSHLCSTSSRCLSSLSAEPFLSGNSSNYVDEMYHSWLKDPESVHKSWNVYFTNLASGAAPGEAYLPPPDLSTSLKATSVSARVSAKDSAIASESLINDYLAIQSLIRAYRTIGHSMADLDPLKINSADLDSSPNPALDFNNYNISNPDMLFHLSSEETPFLPTGEYSLAQIVEKLKDTYCNHIGIEYMHLRDEAEVKWLRDRFEDEKRRKFENRDKRLIIERLIRSQRFEEFLAKKWTSEKRFGLEGCEVLIPALKYIIDKANGRGCDTFVFGMPHRGRLNVLANVARKPLAQLFSQFDSKLSPEDEGSGDVKYHLGVYQERLNHVTNKKVKIMVAANPSHLEAVDPVVMGKTRAEQFYRKDFTGEKVMGVLLHGDAAFSGQGVVYESFHLSDLPAYTTHGIIHIVVNNQIGFTTDPRYSRSSPYCTDVAKVVGAPIFHVNGDDPEAVLHACHVAVDYRSKFGKDVVVDIVCYRKNGHNEIDEPSFTQPLMYKKIRNHQPALLKYLKKCIAEGVITQEEYEAHCKEYDQVCETAHYDAKVKPTLKNSEWLDSPWTGFFARQKFEYTPTGISEETIKHIGDCVASIKDTTFKAHPGIMRILKGRKDMIANRTVDWALAEAIAFGSLLKEGHHVRLSGQDSERGTFSHRHHVLHDQNVDKKFYVQLNQLYDDQGHYSVCNSSLSEYAVLGFELGYSLTSPNALIVWEAQFGDFSNVAQCVIDQFIASGQTKWHRQTGLVLLLPHGMEGMGPEHSSARLERFLQLTSDDPDVYPTYHSDEFTLRQLNDINMFVLNCSTPANFFHALRRQLTLPFRKPLIVMSPKSLLRLPEARSSFDELSEGTKFKRVLGEKGLALQNKESVKKLIFCSGKIYYDIVKERERLNKVDQIAVARIEQICPFPFDRVRQECNLFPNASVVWMQEEHKNQGAFEHVRPRILTSMKYSRPISYIGRNVSPSPATGNKVLHARENQAMLEEAMRLE